MNTPEAKEATMRMLVGAAAAALATSLASILAAACAVASQGPGVGQGSASPLQQSIVALFIAGLGAVCVLGLVLMLLGDRSE
jgi:hypothetical protein